MDERDDDHPAGVRRRKSVSEQKDRKPWEAGSVNAGAEERAVDVRLDSEVCEGWGLCDGLMRWFLLCGQGLNAARSAYKACWVRPRPGRLERSGA